MIEDRCIDCGECIKVCTKNAVVPLTASPAGLGHFDYTVAVPSPALYTQFDLDVTPGTIHQALRNSGFDAAATLSWSCGAVTHAIELFLAGYRGPGPLISSFCPSVVRLVQIKYPELVDQLLPVLSPREVAAREAKRRASADTGLPPDRIHAVYVTPCPAKMVSIVDHPGHGGVVHRLGGRHQRPVPAARAGHPGGPDERREACPKRRPPPAWAGRSRSTCRARCPAEDTMSVWGLPNVLRILDDIDKGKLQRYTFIECHACFEGCVSGALTVENPYVARARALRLQQSLPKRDPVDRADMRGAPRARRVPDDGAVRRPPPAAARPRHRHARSPGCRSATASPPACRGSTAARAARPPAPPSPRTS